MTDLLVDNLWGITLPCMSLIILVGVFWATGILRWAARRIQKETCLFRLSIIVAGRNEEQLIAECLNSLFRLEYPSDLLEICFIDDHSTDRTLDIAQGLAEKHPNLRVFSAPPCPTGIGPKKNALSYGISRASGDLLLFTDADCMVNPGWATTMAQCYDDETGAVTGAVLPKRQPGIANRLYYLERVLVRYLAASAIGWDSAASASGGNFSYRRKVLDQLGGLVFSKLPSGDDDLMAQAIHRLGWKVRFASGSESIVTEMRKPSLREFGNAAIRHQSTIRYYPPVWRIAFAISIASALLFVASGILAITYPSFLRLFVAGTALRIMADTVGLIAFSICLRLRLTAIDFLAAEALLPFYSVLRPILSFANSFAWKERLHPTFPSSASESSA